MGLAITLAWISGDQVLSQDFSDITNIQLAGDILHNATCDYQQCFQDQVKKIICVEASGIL